VVAILSQYAQTLEHRDFALVDIVDWLRGRPTGLTPRAKAKLARRERDDAYRARASGATQIRCTLCGGTSLDIPIVRALPFWKRRGIGFAFRPSLVPMNLAKIGDAHVHADKRACQVVRGINRSFFSRLRTRFAR
jgi:hypothetical protein